MLNTTFSDAVQAYEEWKMNWNNSPEAFDEHNYYVELEELVRAGLQEGPVELYASLQAHVYGIKGEIEQ